VRDLLNQAYPSVWVAGEVQRIKEHRSGHLYFEIIEKGEGDRIIGRMEAVIWRKDLQRVRRVLERSGLEIVEGQQIRCRANLDLYPPFGKMQLVVREVDPVFAQGQLAARRRQTLEKLAAAGLLDHNKRHLLPELPLRLALITSEESAAYHDFLSTLRESPYGFRVLFVHAAVQGMGAEAQLVSALRTAARARPDCAVIIRGGGSRSDLAVFDSRPLAEAIAQADFPVLTGLGHEIDQAVADIVAHTALKTPTKVAELLVQRMAQADAALEALSLGIRREAPRPLVAARARLVRVERGLRTSGFRVTAARERLGGVAGSLVRATRRRLRGGETGLGDFRRRFASAAPRLLESRRHRPEETGRRILALARARLREQEARLSGLSRLAGELAPERALERGFTMTRDQAGRLVRQVSQVRPGERITTTLADGELTSRVEES
jgi:exodeoxyribonuclease VII large subunit